MKKCKYRVCQLKKTDLIFLRSNMVIEISHKKVLSNLIRFKETLESRSELATKKREDKERVYLILLNLETGDIRFAQKISELESQFPRTPVEGESYRHWKQVRLVVQEQGGATHFDVCDANEKPIGPSDVELPVAWTIVSETMNVLNTIAKVTQVAAGGLLPEDAILSSANLSSIQIAPSHDRIEDLKEWVGRLDRDGAERLLLHKPVGAYVLRELDPIMDCTVNALKRNNKIDFLKSCLLTIVEEKNKISDMLLIRTKKGWIAYQDDVDFNSPIYVYHALVQSLLHEIIKEVRGIM